MRVLLSRLVQNRWARVALAAALAAVAAAVSCSSDPSEAVSTTPLPLEQCIPGWWVDDPPSPCEGACLVGTPECGQPDCEQRGFYGYMPDGTTIEGIYSYSASASTVSSLAPLARRAYAIVSDTGVRIDPPGNVFDKVCYSDRLEGDHVKKLKAESGIIAAIEEATANGGDSFRGASTSR